MSQAPQTNGGGGGGGGSDGGGKGGGGGGDLPLINVISLAYISESVGRVLIPVASRLASLLKIKLSIFTLKKSSILIIYRLWFSSFASVLAIYIGQKKLLISKPTGLGSI